MLATAVELDQALDRGLFDPLLRHGSQVADAAAVANVVEGLAATAIGAPVAAVALVAAAESLPSSLTERPVDDRQAAIRRCVDGIVVDRTNGTLRIELPTVPTVAGGSLAPHTEKVLVALNGACPESPA